MEPLNFESLVSDYQAFVFDAYGVLNDADGPIPGAMAALASLQQRNIPFCVLTNDASRGHEEMARKYRFEGRQIVSPEQVISSGSIACEVLSQTHRGKRVAYLGPMPAALAFIEPWAGASCDLMDAKPSDRFDVVMIMDDVGFDWELGLNKALNLLHQNPEIEWIAPNPDLLYHAGPGRIGLAAGALALAVGNALQRPIVHFGKPQRSAFAAAFAYLGGCREGLQLADVVMIGDNPVTDIRGANAFGMDCALVLSGATLRTEDAQNSVDRPTHICHGVSLTT